MTTLYTAEQITKIKDSFDSLTEGVLKLNLDDKKLIFTKSSKSGIYIQRLENFALGLAYNKEKDEFYFNYPHIENAKDISTLNKMSIIQEKENGTNLGILKVENNSNVIYRTRGSINPEMILNEINRAIASNSESLVGINKTVFQDFLKRYKPIYEEGKKKGFIDEFGNLVIKNAANELTNALNILLLNNREIIGIFGEFISKYNPIVVDETMSIGINLNSTYEYEYKIFDILVKDDVGTIKFLPFDEVQRLLSGRHLMSNTFRISLVDSSLLLNIKEFESLYAKNEEGVVIKSDEGYFKYKKEQVLAWERLVSNLHNIVKHSVEHVLSETGISANEVLNGDYKNKSKIDDLLMSVFEEIKTNGITKSMLEDFYKENVDDIITKLLYMGIVALIASVLKDNGIEKQELYKEIPKYLYFDSSPLIYNERRKKELPTKEYSFLIRWVIGSVFS